MASGKGTCEHCIISSHLSLVVETLAKTVNPGSFAQKLQDARLIGHHVVEQAQLGSKTPSERIHPVVVAIQAQTELDVSVYYQFIAIVKEFNPVLGEVLSKFLGKQMDDIGIYLWIGVH